MRNPIKISQKICISFSRSSCSFKVKYTYFKRYIF